MCKPVFSKDSVQWAYCIFHQKLNVYKDSSDPGQRDEIENVVASYAMSMNSELYRYISKGKPSFRNRFMNIHRFCKKWNIYLKTICRCSCRP